MKTVSQTFLSTVRKSTLLIALALIATSIGSSAAFAQDSGKKAPALPESSKENTVLEPDSLEVNKMDPNHQRVLALFIGIEHLEKLSSIPQGASFKGDFKKVSIVGINRDTSTLRFQAISEGVATLTVHDAAGQKIYEFRIDVRKSNLTKVANEVRSLLADIEGVSIKIANNKVIVDGQVLLPKDVSRVDRVVGQYGDQAASLVVLSPLAQRKIAQAIANDIDNPEITVRSVNGRFILEGMAEDATAKDRAEAIAQMYVPEDVVEQSAQIKVPKKVYILNLIQLKTPAPKDPGKIIQLVVHYVELNKNYQKSFRFQFTPTLEDQSQVSFTNDSRSPGSIVSSITGIVSGLLPKLNWAKSHGHARVLQSSSLQVLDGQKGDLRNVVKIPYATIGTNGQTMTQFEEAGFITTITPAIINPRSDSVRLNMDFSMKALLGLTDRGPMVSNNSMQTVIIVRSGQSAAVGGLIGNTNGTDYNKLPKSEGTDPIISLYASKNFQRNQSQFVVFVTPIIKSSASQGAEKIKEKFRLRD